MSLPDVTAALIVRDEQDSLPACLAALAGVAARLVVYDTGSTDGTRELARQAGAVVVEGYWDGDFGRARNAALDLVRTPWALVVDADEEAVVDPAALARHLDGARKKGVEVFACVVRNLRPAADGGPYTHPGLRLLRVDAARYRGRVHEQPGRRDGGRLRAAGLPEGVLHVVHRGYAERSLVRRKALRNATLARAQLVALVEAGAPQESPAVATTLLDLGRALAGAGQVQDAADTFETLRAVAPAQSSPWREGSDHLARLLLAAGHDEAVVRLAEQMRAAGAPGAWCDWLRAQALVQLGRGGEAAALLAGIDVLVDTGGRTYDSAPLHEARSLVQALLPAPRDR